MKKILYVDLDNVLVDFPSGISRTDEDTLKKYDGELDNVPGIFALMKPMPGAIEAYKELSEKFDTYILSTSPWDNPSAWSDKLEWVKKYLGEVAYKRLILTHHKNLNKGDYLIDDRTKRGASEFEGELILFGSEKFPDWDSVLKYLGSGINWGQATVDALREATKEKKKIFDRDDIELVKASKKAGEAFVANLNRKVKEGK